MAPEFPEAEGSGSHTQEPLLGDDKPEDDFCVSCDAALHICPYASSHFFLGFA